MERIMIARKKMKWTQEQLATAIGVKRAIISKYENGSVEPSIAQIRKIAEALNTSISYLLGDTDNPDDMSFHIVATEMAFKEVIDRQKDIQEKVKAAEAKLMKAVYSICTGKANYTAVTELYNQEFLPTRISIITEFILSNKDFLRKNMPGITDVDKRDN